MSRGPDKQFDPEAALQKAMEVFWAKGFAATSLCDLLDAMGIARKSLYDTFGNKRELFCQALERYARNQRERVQQELQRPGSPLANLRRVLEWWCVGEAQQPDRGCMLGTNAAHFQPDDAEMLELLRGHLCDIEQDLLATLQRARAAGEIRADLDLQDLARLLLAAAQGSALVGRTRPETGFSQAVVRAALAALQPR